jgi:hypothetical protein
MSNFNEIGLSNPLLFKKKQSPWAYRGKTLSAKLKPGPVRPLPSEYR